MFSDGERVKFKKLDWNGVQWAVHQLAHGLIAQHGERRVRKAPGVYGPPRGGLPLAVAMSHALNLPLLKAPKNGCIWIDDIYDSGRTLRRDRKRADRMMPCVWIAHFGCPILYARAVDDDTWTVFPWEDATRAAHEARTYAASRQ